MGSYQDYEGSPTRILRSHHNFGGCPPKFQGPTRIFWGFPMILGVSYQDFRVPPGFWGSPTKILGSHQDCGGFLTILGVSHHDFGGVHQNFGVLAGFLGGVLHDFGGLPPRFWDSTTISGGGGFPHDFEVPQGFFGGSPQFWGSTRILGSYQNFGGLPPGFEFQPRFWGSPTTISRSHQDFWGSP